MLKEAVNSLVGWEVIYKIGDKKVRQSKKFVKFIQLLTFPLQKCCARVLIECPGMVVPAE